MSNDDYNNERHYQYSCHCDTLIWVPESKLEAGKAWKARLGGLHSYRPSCDACEVRWKEVYGKDWE
jgi:hypothetical protein